MLTQNEKKTLWKIFKEQGAEGLSMSHYDLAECTEATDPNKWKEFLLEQDVRNYIQTEMELVRAAEINKMITNVSDNNRSVGQAQLMSALDRLKQNSNTKEGPVFIYTYVPLSAEQEQAENVEKLDEDPFWRRG